MTQRSQAGRARLVVLAMLLSTATWGVVIPWALADPPTTAAAIGYAAGLGVVALALALMLRAAVTIGVSGRSRGLSVWLLVGATGALWAPAFAWSEPHESTWAWLAGGALGVIPFVASRRTTVTVAVVLTGLAALGGVLFDDRVIAAVLTTWGMAAVVGLTGQVLIWLLRLLTAAETSRETEADLAVAQERLRLSRELHDVLGHRLGVIALKAELAADLVSRDAQRARKEADEIKSIAASTMSEARRAFQGDTVSDLATQLRSATLVLSSAGIETTIDVDDRVLPRHLGRLAAMVVRESVTNVLRHSDARVVSTTLETTGRSSTLVIVNDGVRTRTGETDPGDSSGGTGLASLAARCAAAGARLRSGPTGDGRFEVRLVLPTGHEAQGSTSR